MNLYVIVSLIFSFLAMYMPYVCAIKLESEMLHHADGSVINWKVIADILRYRANIKKFLGSEYTIGTKKFKLIDLALLEQARELPGDHGTVFSKMVLTFLAFSAQFIVTLRPLKGALNPLIEESRSYRGCPDSLLVLWTTSADGQEEDLFKKTITSYRILGELCTELLHFTRDLLDSCPKAIAAHEAFFERVKFLEPLIDELLAADGISMLHTSVAYHNLVRYIAEMYGTGEVVNQEKTTRLYRAYQAKNH
jgi:hypothetical protein